VRATDWVARYGGEEICAVPPDTTLDAAVAIGARILAEVRLIRSTLVDGRSFGVTASIGVVESRGQKAGVPELVQRASDKMREAKKAGKNRLAS
jgi:two-component system cell cycle response regulator